MEGHCSTVQSPLQVVEPMEEEEEVILWGRVVMPLPNPQPGGPGFYIGVSSPRVWPQYA